ncbi:hypothetical protein C8F04DRAFT_1229171 [Mycena alexandri]|uniref:Uncharacterized protein n=1 Tax=Mycena alexandri TaxID=1745969 RepID=A0AAD6TDJ2_9AGAR|nr:hypothetical protein C8F04DRAFT_1229171 [Mycena alexandri]
MSWNNNTFIVSLDGPDSERWAPSMPNSDLLTLTSPRDVAKLMPEMKGRIVPIRVVAVPTTRSPLGLYPPWTAPAFVPTAGPPSVPPPAVALTQPLSTPDSVSDINTPTAPQPLQQSRSAIGLGHPSTSKRRNLPLELDVVAASSQTSPTPRPRINSSTIKRRTERFPGRELHVIVEDPVTEKQQQSSVSPSRPVSGTRRRSYAMAVSAPETPKHSTGRRVTPTRPAFSSSSPTLPSTGSPRCASKPSSNTFVSSMTALAPRYTVSGAPQAGPTQVQSPRVLFPATMAGSPRFQSLDGAVMAITKATEAEAEEVEVEERAGGGDSELLFYEDGFIKFKVHTRIRLRFAAKRLSMLF